METNALIEQTAVLVELSNSFAAINVSLIIIASVMGLLCFGLFLAVVVMLVRLTPLIKSANKVSKNVSAISDLVADEAEKIKASVDKTRIAYDTVVEEVGATFSLFRVGKSMGSGLVQLLQSFITKIANRDAADDEVQDAAPAKKRRRVRHTKKETQKK